MKYRYDGYNWLVRLERGERLAEQLTKFIKQENIQSAWVSGLGTAQSAELGYYDLDAKEYRFRTIGGMFEISSLTGNIAWKDDEPVLHLHVALADESLQTFGGHLKDLETGGTVELMLHKWYDGRLERKHDESTGLNLLDL